MLTENCIETNKLCPPTNLISVSDFFKGKDIFITGGTGFMGKVLIEKLLWSCEDIGNIYVLIREKKGATPSNRIEKMIKLPVYDRLRSRNSNIFSKIIPITGDVSEPNLGIKDDDRKILENHISIIFHAAASVQFNDPLKKAILYNVRATRDVMELAKNMKNLKVVTYVSTSYCNSDRSIIEERVYPSNYDWRLIIKLAETFDESILNILEPKILVKKPNTYTFTKQLAENIVYEYSKTIPSMIFRPSIVTYCMEEPIPGWIDNLNGPTGINTAISTGLLHVLYGNMNHTPDYVPCDYTIKGLIISTWYRGISDVNKCHVVNGASNGKRDFSINNLNKYKDDVYNYMPSSKMLWYPTFITTTNKLTYYTMLFLTHLIPGLFLDAIFNIKKIKFSLMKIYRQIFIANQALAYFLVNNWNIPTNNYDALLTFVSPNDKDNFNYDITQINEEEALYLGQIGMKKYINKEDITESAVAIDRVKIRRMYWIHMTFRSVFFIFLAWILWKILKRYLSIYLKNIY